MWKYIARRGLYALKDELSSMVLDIAFVIEGRSNDEWPEQVLGCAQIVRPKMNDLVEKKFAVDV